jgi:hypothetical protein
MSELSSKHAVWWAGDLNGDGLGDYDDDAGCYRLDANGECSVFY